MTSAICTLFEGDHHYGVGALANSVYTKGFRGTIFAGYRGSLPPWAKGIVKFEQYDEYSPVDGVVIRFIPLTINLHLGNYKPDFMLDLWADHCSEVQTLFYFDPDIVVEFPWNFFEDWASNTIAMCEDVNSPMPHNHPKRNAWRRLFESWDSDSENKLEIYVNSGFVGLPKRFSAFLEIWAKYIKFIGESGADMNSLVTLEDYRFWNNDQDALNIAAMATKFPISLASKEGMGFVLTKSFMLHAVGPNKPWRTKLFRQFISGKRPTPVLRAFWENVASPIQVFSPAKIAIKRNGIKLAAFGGRFYSS